MPLQYDRFTPVLTPSHDLTQIRLLAVRDGDPVYVDIKTLYFDKIVSNLESNITEPDEYLTTVGAANTWMSEKHIPGPPGPKGDTSMITNSQGEEITAANGRAHIFKVLSDHGIQFDGTTLKCVKGSYKTISDMISEDGFFEGQSTNVIHRPTGPITPGTNNSGIVKPGLNDSTPITPGTTVTPNIPGVQGSVSSGGSTIRRFMY